MKPAMSLYTKNTSIIQPNSRLLRRNAIKIRFAISMEECSYFRLTYCTTEPPVHNWLGAGFLPHAKPPCRTSRTHVCIWRLRDFQSALRHENHRPRNSQVICGHPPLLIIGAPHPLPGRPGHGFVTRAISSTDAASCAPGFVRSSYSVQVSRSCQGTLWVAHARCPQSMQVNIGCSGSASCSPPDLQWGSRHHRQLGLALRTSLAINRSYLFLH